MATLNQISLFLQSGGGVANAINKRYHTVDRNQRLSREQQQQQKQSHPRARVASTTIGSYTQYPPPSSSSSPRRSSRREATAAPAPTYGHSDNSDRSYREVVQLDFPPEIVVCLLCRLRDVILK